MQSKTFLTLSDSLLSKGFFYLNRAFIYCIYADISLDEKNNMDLFECK